MGIRLIYLDENLYLQRNDLIIGYVFSLIREWCHEQYLQTVSSDLMSDVVNHYSWFLIHDSHYLWNDDTLELSKRPRLHHRLLQKFQIFYDLMQKS